MNKIITSIGLTLALLIALALAPVQAIGLTVQDNTIKTSLGTWPNGAGVFSMSSAKVITNNTAIPDHGYGVGMNPPLTAVSMSATATGIESSGVTHAYWRNGITAS